MPSYNVKVKFYSTGEIQLHTFPVSVSYGVDPKSSGCRCFDSSDNLKDKTAGKKNSSPTDRSTSNFARSIRRTKNTVFDFSLNHKWDYFVTLTFDKENFDRYDFDSVSKYTRKFLNNFKNRYCYDLQYIGLPEFHKDGAIHYHFLMSGAHLSFYLADHTDQKHYPGCFYLTSWKSNSIFEPVKNSVAVACYMCKYVVKDIIVHSGHARYIRSRNLTSPEEETFFYYNDELEGLDLSSYCLKQFEEDFDIISCSDGIGGSNYFRLMPKKSPE